MPALTTRRKIGIEPREVDLTVGPGMLTAADRQELGDFFRAQRRLNDQSPSVRAVRQQLAAKKSTAPRKATPPAKAAVSTIAGIGVSISGKRLTVAVPARQVYAAKAAPAARKAAPAKNK